VRLLFCGDIVGRPGRDAVAAALPELRRTLALDLVVANGENAAGGFGLTPPIAEELAAAGVDVLTSGNHVWDKREIIPALERDPRLLRPHNFPRGTPGQGARVYTLPGGQRALVVNVMTRLFMDPLDCPFQAVDAALAGHALGGSVQAILVDVHGEATSEKMALGHHLDGRASLVVGSHSHVPTADAQVLPGGTAYQTDAGMCGDYDSVIGMRKDIAIARFVRKMPGDRLAPAEGEGTLCAVFVETDDRTGRARRVAPVRVGGRLAPTRPDP